MRSSSVGDHMAKLAAIALLAGVLVPARAAESGEAGQESQLPAWVRNISVKGDFRYRNETIEQQYVDRRNRDRLRVRAAIAARVNDTVRVDIGLATSENNDPRSSNVTLGRSNSRKDLFLDQASVEWQPRSWVTLTGGKMKYPWRRAGESVLFDGDVNPEGLAVRFGHDDFFASLFHHFIAERSNDSESTLVGAQGGWQPRLGEARLTLAAGYFDFRRVRGRDPFHEGNPFGNSITSVGCHGGLTACLAQDFDLVEAFAEWNLPVAGQPLALFADLITNQAAQNGEDTAWSAGVGYGRADGAGTWKISYIYQRVEKDAVFAQLLDSDIGAGNTDHRAHVLRVGYGIARNWNVEATWHHAKTELFAPAVVNGTPVRGRRYQRLQLDLNFRF